MHRRWNERSEFDKSANGLPALRVELWAGFIFVNMDASAPALAPTLASYEPYLANYDLDHAVCASTFTLTDLPWNWKVMFENFNDGYHANRLHQFVQDFCPSANSAFPAAWDDSANVIFRTAGYTHIDGGFNATHRTIMPVFPRLTDEERTRSTFALIPPTLCFGTAPDQCFFFLVRPKSVGTIDVEIGYLFHPTALDDPLFEHKLAVRRRRAGVRPPGPGCDHEGATGAQLTVRTAWPILVAGGESRAVQPVARAALPQVVADASDRVAPPDRLSSPHGLTISPAASKGEPAP